MEELDSITNLTDALKAIPGIGSKSASRIAYEFLKMDKLKVTHLVDALNDIEEIQECPKCGCYLQGAKCPNCDDNNRTNDELLVVSSYKDIFAFEKLHYKGRYHIIKGYINPSKGITPSALKIDKLIERIDSSSFKEVILALSLTLEGETTSQYIAKLLSNKNIKVSRLASGLPMGAILDYADELTLSRAFSNRNQIK